MDDKIKLLNELNTSTYVESVAELLKNEVVEVYIGESYESIKLDQSEYNTPAVIICRILGGHKDCLMVQMLHADENDKKTLSTSYINGWSIKLIKKVDGNNLEASFLTSKKTPAFKKAK